MIFYHDTNFSGHSASHSFARNEPDLLEIPNSNNLKISNDQLSSLKVGRGVKLTIFGDNGYRGARLVFCEGEYASLPCDWSDEMTSFRMEKIDAKIYPTVKLYSNYGEGNWKKERVSSITIGNWDDEICDDEISAIEVPYGVEVTIYQDGGFRGREYTFKKPATYRLSEYGMNDAVSSIKVTKLKYVLKSVEYTNRKLISSNKKENIETTSTARNNLSTDLTDRVKISKTFTNTISATSSNSNTAGVEITTRAQVSPKVMGAGAELETSLALKYEHTWVEEKGKEESISDNVEKEVEVQVPPGKSTTVRLVAEPVVVEYDVVRTYSPESGGGPDIKETSKVRMKYAVRFDAIADYEVSGAGGSVSGDEASRVVCSGKTYVLNKAGDIYDQNTKIGYGVTKMECSSNQLVATVTNGTRLKYDGRPGIWSPAVPAGSVPGGEASRVVCNGKTYILNKTGDIYDQNIKIGYGVTKMECSSNQLVATVTNGARLQYDGQPMKWSAAK